MMGVLRRSLVPDLGGPEAPLHHPKDVHDFGSPFLVVAVSGSDLAPIKRTHVMSRYI